MRYSMVPGKARFLSFLRMDDRNRILDLIDSGMATFVVQRQSTRDSCDNQDETRLKAVERHWRLGQARDAWQAGWKRRHLLLGGLCRRHAASNSGNRSILRIAIAMMKALRESISI